jgi:hypothetical protein
MQYHIGRNGSQLGSFPEEEIRSGLQNGTFLPEDLAWKEGMPEWQPLSVVMPGTPTSPVAGTLSLEKAAGSTPGGPMGSGSPSSSPQPAAPYSPATVWPPAPGGVAHVGVAVMPVPGTAIASLVLGIVAMVTCYFGFLFAVPGVICGHIAMGKIKASGNRFEGKGLALAGLILSYVWIGLFVAAMVLLIVFGAFGAFLDKVN